MEHETTLEYTVPLLREAVRGFWRRTVGVGLQVGLVLYAGLLVLFLARGDRSWLVGMMAFVLCFALVFIVALYVVHYRNALRKFRAMGEPRATFRAGDDSITVSSGAGSSTLPWSSITEVWKLQNCWLLLFSKAQFVTLPLSCLREETRAFIAERVRAAGGKVDG